MEAGSFIGTNMALFLEYLSLQDIHCLRVVCCTVQTAIAELNPIALHAASLAGHASPLFANAECLKHASRAHIHMWVSASPHALSFAGASRAQAAGSLTGCSGASAVALGGDVFVFGGNVSGNPSSRLVCLSPVPHGDVAPPPPFAEAVLPKGDLCPLPREGHAMMPCHGGLLVHGGELCFPTRDCLPLLAVASAWEATASAGGGGSWFKQVPQAQLRSAVETVIRAGALGTVYAALVPPVAAAAAGTQASAGEDDEVRSAVRECLHSAERLNHAMSCAAEAGMALYAAFPLKLSRTEVCAAASHVAATQRQWKVSSSALWHWHRTSCRWSMVPTQGSGPFSSGHSCVAVRGRSWHGKLPVTSRTHGLSAAEGTPALHAPLSQETELPRRIVGADDDRDEPQLVAAVCGGCRWVLQEQAPAGPVAAQSPAFAWGMQRAPMSDVRMLDVQLDKASGLVLAARWRQVDATWRSGSGVGGGSNAAVLPSPRNGAAASAAAHGIGKHTADSVVLFGGFDGKRVLGDTWVLSAQSQGRLQWEPLSSGGQGGGTTVWPAPRADACMVRVGHGTVALLGGIDTCAVQDVWTLRLGSRGWRRHHPHQPASAPACAGGEGAGPLVQYAETHMNEGAGYCRGGLGVLAPGMVACALPVSGAARDKHQEGTPVTPLLWVGFGEKVDWRGRVLEHVAATAVIALF